MAFSKEEIFNLLPQLVSKQSRVLGHPARIRIILHLAEHGTSPFSDLLKMLPLRQSTVSQHVEILLRNTFIVVHEKVPHTYYGLNYEEVRRFMLVAKEFLAMLFSFGIDPKDMVVPDDEVDTVEGDWYDEDESGG
jgi:DNA-binding transcriptional ArsR family regulator